MKDLIEDEMSGFSAIPEIPYSMFSGVLRIGRTRLAIFRGGRSFEAMRVDLQ